MQRAVLVEVQVNWKCAFLVLRLLLLWEYPYFLLVPEFPT